MKINIKDAITLNDGNKYIVVSKAVYNDNTYYYLLDSSNPGNMKFCLDNNNKNNSILEIEDKVLIQKLLPIFLTETKKVYQNHTD